MTREKANKEILAILTKLLEKQPDLRFGQALSILEIDDNADFMEEPAITLKRVRRQVREIKLSGGLDD
jgi:hypothetical protein